MCSKHCVEYCLPQCSQPNHKILNLTFHLQRDGLTVWKLISNQLKFNPDSNLSDVQVIYLMFYLIAGIIQCIQQSFQAIKLIFHSKFCLHLLSTLYPFCVWLCVVALNKPKLCSQCSSLSFCYLGVYKIALLVYACCTMTWCNSHIIIITVNSTPIVSPNERQDLWDSRQILDLHSSLIHWLF